MIVLLFSALPVADCLAPFTKGIILSGLRATTNFPTTGSKLSDTPSDVKKTMSPSSTTVMEQVKLLSSGFWPSTGPKAPNASLISLIELTSCEPAKSFSLNKKMRIVQEKNQNLP